MGEAFLHVQRVLSLLVAPITVILFFFAQPLVEVVLGDKWLPMVPAFRLLALWGGLRALRETVGSVFRAVGWPAITAWTTLAKLALMAALLWPARRYGITGVSAVVLLTSVLEIPVIMWFAARELKLPYVSIYHSLLPPCIIALFAGWITFQFRLKTSAPIELIWGLCGISFAYLLIMSVLGYVFDLDHFTDVQRLWSIVRMSI
jgi:O-antigen/teichoic acid export membrane protein